MDVLIRLSPCSSLAVNAATIHYTHIQLFEHMLTVVREKSFKWFWHLPKISSGKQFLEFLILWKIEDSTNMGPVFQ